MKNPLRKRLLRELRSEMGKYIVILALMILSIGFVSGFLVADGSMIIAYNESFEKYNVEDGNFTVSDKLNKTRTEIVEDMGITLYNNFYIEEELTNGSTLRIFKDRTQVNKACLMSGEMPEEKNEIAIDRMYADNNDLSVGATITCDEASWKITGLVALPDYSALFSDNNDSMFDAIKFGVAIVTEDGFDALDPARITYCYSWKYNTPPADEAEENDIAQDLVGDLAGEVDLKDFIPQYQNQAITFTGEDMGSDKGMMIMLLYMIIAIMAFVFAVTTSNTISKEANVIGTLRASGYTRSELVRHYLTMPMIVTLIGALIGNILGYTFMKDICASMYYGSYSLPTYETVWNGEAFIMTTVVPLIMMLIINWAILRYKLTLPPLKFLRRDLRRRKQKRTLPLPKILPFFTRFRLRVIFQNMSNYVVLIIGICFAYLMLMFGLGLPALLDEYQNSIENNMLCKYQYVLSVPFSAMDDDHKFTSLLSMMKFQYEVETDNEDAEKFSMYTLRTLGDNGMRAEDIAIYGVDDESSYIHTPLPRGSVVISETYADKYELGPGDTITLKEKYEDDLFTFTVTGIYDYPGAICIFMNRDDLNEKFDLGDGYFCGYFSDSEITDIDEKYIGSVIDLDDLTKICNQLNVSMGGMMKMVDGFAVLIFMIIVYLLSKLIIEKNAQAISMTKILGYTNGEISRLYIMSTTLVVIFALIVTIPGIYVALEKVYRVVMAAEMSGWLPLSLPNSIFIEMFVIGICTYAVVAFLELRRVKRVPMDEALKNVE